MKEIIQVGAHLINTVFPPQKNKKIILMASLVILIVRALHAFYLKMKPNTNSRKLNIYMRSLSVYQNTFNFKYSFNIANFISTTIIKRPKFDLFKVSIEKSYLNETEYYACMAELLSSMITYQKDQENLLTDS